MAGDEGITRAKVQQYLTRNFGDVNIHADGNYSLRNGSTRLFVSIRTFEEEASPSTWVILQIPVLCRIQESPAVFEYVALHCDDYIVGHLGVRRTDDGLIITCTHTLLGDYLDEEELVRAVAFMLVSADMLDDELEKHFGGVRVHEE